jgi:hypothetical protein
VPSNIDPWPEVRDKLNRSLRGWSNFRDAIKKHAGANESAWTSAKTKLETEWSVFEAEVSQR